jgi:battenin
MKKFTIYSNPYDNIMSTPTTTEISNENQLSFIEQCTKTIENRLFKVWEKHYEYYIIVSYWFLGLCNNYGYVIMLSAAHDILKQDEQTNSTTNETINTNSSTNTNRFDCNPIGTGAILLCDILPGLIVKLIAPFFINSIPYSYRAFATIIFNILSFLLVALTPSNLTGLVFVGVMLVELKFIDFLSFFCFYF